MMQDMLFWSFPALWLKTSVDSHLSLSCMAMAAAAVDWLKMGASQVGEVEVEVEVVVVVVVVVVMLIVIVDVDVYTTFQQSHVIKRDPEKKSMISLHITQ